MDKNKLVLPISILLAGIILGGFYYASQASKQQRNRADVIFSNNLKCQTLLKDFQQRKEERISKRSGLDLQVGLNLISHYTPGAIYWDDAVGIYYSERQNTCIIKYVKDGKTGEAPIESVQDIN